MRRQNVRKLLLIISMLLFPITIWYMSPYLIIQGATEGIVTGSFNVFLYMTDHGISIAEIYDYVIYYGVVFLILIPAVLFGKRIFCHYFCWMAPFMVIGTKIRNLLHLPGIHVASEKENCIFCKKCNQECPMGLNVVELVKNDSDFGTECIQCGACVDNCPKKALLYRFKRDK